MLHKTIYIYDNLKKYKDNNLKIYIIYLFNINGSIIM